MQDKATKCYIISEGTDLYKIGRATDTEIRRAQLQTGNPRPLELLLETELVSEEKMHQLFDKYHVNGEWFRISKDKLGTLIRAINDLNSLDEPSNDIQGEPDTNSIQDEPTPEEFEDGSVPNTNDVYHSFWEGLLARAGEKTDLFANISPSHEPWIGTSMGLPNGLELNFVVRRHDARVELYFHNKKAELNKEAFARLLAHKEEIESAFGETLEWDAIEGKKACRISKVIPIAGWQDFEQWPEEQDVLIEVMIRLDGAIRPHLHT